MVSSMCRKMRTGSVVVDGEATKMDIVSSSKLVMKAITQPLITPGSTRGNTTRRKATQLDAPSDSAARSSAGSMPVAEASTSRNAYGMMRMTCAITSPKYVPTRPTVVKNFRKARPSTTCGIISGDMKNASSASRPGKRLRAMASAPGTASTMAMDADNAPSPMLNQNASMKRGLSRMARNQRSDRPPVGSEMKPSDVNATAHTITMGARMNAMNTAWNSRANGPFLEFMSVS